MPRRTADLIALILTVTVAVTVILTAAATLFVEIVHPEQDTEPAAMSIGRIVSTVIAALVGYMAGRTTEK